MFFIATLSQIIYSWNLMKISYFWRHEVKSTQPVSLSPKKVAVCSVFGSHMWMPRFLKVIFCLLNNYCYKEVLRIWIYSLSNNSTWMGIPALIVTFISVCSTFHNFLQSFPFSVIKLEAFYPKAYYTVFYNKIYWNLWSIILNIKIDTVWLRILN